MTLSLSEIALTDEVMDYFDNEDAPFAPSHIDWAMGLRPGVAHDLIVRAWHKDKEARLSAISDSYKRKRGEHGRGDQRRGQAD